MNTNFALIAAVAALVSSADAAACTTTQQQSAYLGMVGLLAGTSLTNCGSSSGYNMLYATALPSDTERVAMCGVQACHDLIVAVLATNPPDCDLTIPTSGAVMNVHQLASTFESECDALTATTAPPTEAPTSPPTEAPTSPPTEAPTTAPTDAPTSAPTDSPTTAPT
uniref:Elicitin n=2 Tax=Phytophthora ramorum TaxID=164328 RepID=H3G6R1_PHYRM